MLKAEETIFYSIESTIKTYRKFAQLEIRKVNSKITLDQSMLLKKLIEQPDITQMDLAKLIFKDFASVTRMIDLLVKNGFITREVNPNNRRRNTIKVTKETILMMDKITEIVKYNREIALHKINNKEINFCQRILEKIKNNINDK